MSEWRVILTDSESLTGVAPDCPDMLDPLKHAGAYDVQDCCPQPHIECWSEYNALEVVHLLTDIDAKWL